MTTLALLSGGTATVAVQVHALGRILLELDAIASVSGGALNGALAASGRMKDLRSTWGDVNGRKWFMRPNLDPWNGLHTLNPLRRQMRKRHVTLADLKIPFYVGAVDLAAGQYVSILCNDLPDDEAYHEAILASAAQPVIMEARWPLVNGSKRLCVDGGVLAVLPKVPRDYDLGPGDTIYALFGPPVGSAREERLPTRDVRNAIQAGLRVLELWIDMVVREDLRRLQVHARDGVEVIVVSPPYSGDPFDASPKTNKWRLDTIGPDIWENRRRMTPDGALILL